MGFFRALDEAFRGTLADQWLEIITAPVFDEHTIVAPGVFKNTNSNVGINRYASENVISKGSRVYVPDNTAAFVMENSAIVNIITTPGAYEFLEGEDSVFYGDPLGGIWRSTSQRMGFGGSALTEKKISYVNLKEIRNIKFGTKNPLVYNDLYYGVDLELLSYGSFTVQVVDPEKLVRNFIPANMPYYSFDALNVRKQIVAEFMQSFMAAVNTLSKEYRLSQLPSHVNDVTEKITMDRHNAGTWIERFGFKLAHVAIENIQFSDASRELVTEYTKNKINLKAYEDISQKASDIAAQQKMAEGIRNHGFGDGGGFVMGANMAQNFATSMNQNKDTQNKSMTFEEQIEALKKLKELLDIGILTQTEFDKKKKEILML